MLKRIVINHPAINRAGRGTNSSPQTQSMSRLMSSGVNLISCSTFSNGFQNLTMLSGSHSPFWDINSRERKGGKKKKKKETILKNYKKWSSFPTAQPSLPPGCNHWSISRFFPWIYEVFDLGERTGTPLVWTSQKLKCLKKKKKKKKKKKMILLSTETSTTNPLLYTHNTTILREHNQQ